MGRRYWLILGFVMICWSAVWGSDKPTIVHLNFERGFHKDRVEVYVGDKLRYSNLKMKTVDPGHLDIAAATKLELNQGDVDRAIRIFVNKKCVIEFSVSYRSKNVYLGVSLEENGLVHLNLRDYEVGYL